MSSVERLKNGDYMALFHDRQVRSSTARSSPPQYRIYKAISKDGGLTWGRPRSIAEHPTAPSSASRA